MRLPYFGQGPRTPQEATQLKMQTADFVRQRGTQKVPGAPRDIQAQASSRGVLLSWALPAGDSSDIIGWKIYKDDDKTLYDTITNRGTRQSLIPASSGSTPPVTNVFISSINALGVESARIQVQGSATTETGAPSVPSAPPSFSSGNGADTSTAAGQRTFGNKGFPQ